MSITLDVLGTGLSPAVELFMIDVTNTGLATTKFYFQATDQNGVTFSGNTYTWLPIEISGVELSSNGNLPEPTLTMSNVNMTLLSTLVNFDDLIGATLTYIRTFEKYLNNQNGNERFSERKYDILQKTTQTKTAIEFKLGTLLSRDSLKIPGRRATSDIIPGMSLVN